jgi:hypothetical protein
MLNNILNIEGVSLLPKEQQKAINGGYMTPGGCGIKVNGVWHHVPDANGNGNTREDAEGSLNTWVNFPDGGIQVNGNVAGWCCDSCPWNSVQ